MVGEILNQGVKRHRNPSTRGESEDDEVLVSEGEEQEEVGGSTFRKLMANAVEKSIYVYQWFFSCPTPKLTVCHAGKQTSEAVQF